MSYFFNRSCILILIITLFGTCAKRMVSKEKAFKHQKKIFIHQFEIYKKDNLARIQKHEGSGDTSSFRHQISKTDQQNFSGIFNDFNEIYVCPEVVSGYENQGNAAHQGTSRQAGTTFPKAGQPGLLYGNLILAESLIKTLQLKSKKEKCAACHDLANYILEDFNKTWTDTLKPVKLTPLDYLRHKEQLLDIFKQAKCTKL